MMLWWRDLTEDALNRAHARNKQILNETVADFEWRLKEPAKIAVALGKSNHLVSLHIEVLIPIFSHDFGISRTLIGLG
jgi:hypothetical protein